MNKFNKNAAAPLKGISKPALKLIMNYPWPGNVRELESVIERGVLMSESDYIQPEDLPLEVREGPGGGGGLPFDLPPEGIMFEELERELIAKAMERTNGVIGRAAQLLGMSYKTLQYRLEKFGIDKPGKRREE